MFPTLSTPYARIGLWLLRASFLLGAFVLLVRMLQPAPPRPLLNAGGTPQRQHPVLCVHTRLIDEVETWKIQRSLIMAREMGANTIVEFFPWAYLQPSRDRYDWAQADRIMTYAREQGLQVIARFGLVPGWAQAAAREDARRANQPDTMTLNTLPADAYGDFAAFAAAFAARYAGLADHVIIWNEPNLAFEWGYQGVNAPQYADLLRVVYPAVHAANPSATVLLAGLAPTLESPGSTNGLDDLLYLRQIYEAGASPYFDGVAMHTYGFTQSPDIPPAPDRLNFRRAELLHQIMVEHGDGAKPVFITETGWNDHPRWSNAVSPAQRIAYTLDALTVAETDWHWLNALCLWNLRAPAPTFSYPDGFTMVSTEFEPRPIYDAVRAWAHDDMPTEDFWLPAPAR